MPLVAFDHVNIRTCQLDRMVAFYQDVLGLEIGPRPDFSFGGAWLYLNGQAYVHLVEVGTAPRAEDPAIQHFAFSAEDRDGFCRHLESHGVDYGFADVPGRDMVQVRFRDPDGNAMHVDFATTE